MIILNTTFVIEPSITAEVLEWISGVYEAGAIKRGAHDPMLLRVIPPEPQMDPSYAMQLSFDSIDDASKWTEGVGRSLLNIMQERWPQKAMAFCTLLQPIRP